MNPESELADKVRHLKELSYLPHILKIIEQKWKYSHYSHGNVALQAGFLAGRSRRDTVQVASAVEVVWAGILILDDIMDGDEIRYRIASTWKEVGYGPAAEEMLEGLLQGILIIKDNQIRENLIKAKIKTITAMRLLSNSSLYSSLKIIEPLYWDLGALSAFSTSWPWRHKELRKISLLETCAGQLINDCNDCFGDKGKRRNYPDLRNRQSTLLLGILNEAYDIGDIITRIMNAEDKEQFENIAFKILLLVQKNPSTPLKVFDFWMDHAHELTNKIENIDIKNWVVHRVRDNKKMWRTKLIKLIDK